MRYIRNIVGIAGIFSCSLLGTASDQPPSVDKGASTALVETAQVAMLWQKNRTPREIWLLRLTPDELTGKTSVSAARKLTWRADKSNVQAIQLASGEVFKVHPSTGVFARFDPAKRAFVVDAMTEPQGGPDTIVEEAEGSGTTGEEAIRDALRNAVHKAVGVLVDGEVLVKKEDVISDKVLTYSDGFVTSYKELSRKEQDGLTHVWIRAHVEQRKLLADLRTAGVSLGPVDGQGLVASAITRKDALDTGAALLSKTLAELPNVVVAEVRPINALDYDAETHILNLSVSVRVDRTRYLALADSLAAVLNKISLAKTSVLLNTLPTVGVGDHLLDWSQAPLPPVFRFGPDLNGNPKSWCLWLAMRGDAHHRMFRLACYALDENIARALQGTRGKVQVEIALLDAGKDEIAKEVFDPLTCKKRRDFWLGWISPRPRPLVAEFKGQAAAPLLGTANLADLAPAINENMSVNVYVMPRVIAGIDEGNILCAGGVWEGRTLKIEPDVLNRMKEVRSRVVFTPAESSAGEPGKP
jgi:hypothetical protein